MAPEKTPAFQFYPKDFLTDGKVLRMSMAQRGLYITLLSICWTERHLPSGVTELAQMVGLPVQVFRKLWPGVDICFTETPKGLSHKRLDEEREKQDVFRRRMSDRGKKGAENRWAS